jgi:hypothetical protein
MRWLAVWFLLAGIYLAGQLILVIAGGDYGREELLHLLLVPLAQIAALRLVAVVRRGTRRQLNPPPDPPPPPPETPASRPAATR